MNCLHLFTNTAQKMKFSIKHFLSKSAVSSGFGHIYWRSPKWKSSFFVQWKVLEWDLNEKFLYIKYARIWVSFIRTESRFCLYTRKSRSEKIRILGYYGLSTEKLSKYKVFFGPYFFFVFGLNTGKYGHKKSLVFVHFSRSGTDAENFWRKAN